jgi:hypothetical protein
MHLYGGPNKTTTEQSWSLTKNQANCYNDLQYNRSFFLNMDWILHTESCNKFLQSRVCFVEGNALYQTARHRAHAQAWQYNTLLFYILGNTNQLPTRQKYPPWEINFKGTKLPAIQTRAAQCILVVDHNIISPLHTLALYTGKPLCSRNLSQHSHI